MECSLQYGYDNDIGIMVILLATFGFCLMSSHVTYNKRVTNQISIQSRPARMSNQIPRPA